MLVVYTNFFDFVVYNMIPPAKPERGRHKRPAPKSSPVPAALPVVASNQFSAFLQAVTSAISSIVPVVVAPALPLPLPPPPPPVLSPKDPPLPPYSFPKGAISKRVNHDKLKNALEMIRRSQAIEEQEEPEPEEHVDHDMHMPTIAALPVAPSPPSSNPYYTNSSNAAKATFRFLQQLKETFNPASEIFDVHNYAENQQIVENLRGGTQYFAQRALTALNMHRPTSLLSILYRQSSTTKFIALMMHIRHDAKVNKGTLYSAVANLHATEADSVRLMVELCREPKTSTLDDRTLPEFSMERNKPTVVTNKQLFLMQLRDVTDVKFLDDSLPDHPHIVSQVIGGKVARAVRDAMALIKNFQWNKVLKNKDKRVLFADMCALQFFLTRCREERTDARRAVMCRMTKALQNLRSSWIEGIVPLFC